MARGNVNTTKSIRQPAGGGESAELMAQRMRKQLGAEQKVRAMIPLDPLNAKQEQLEISINGVTYLLKRGVQMEIPTTMYYALKDCGAL